MRMHTGVRFSQHSTAQLTIDVVTVYHSPDATPSGTTSMYRCVLSVANVNAKNVSAYRRHASWMMDTSVILARFTSRSMMNMLVMTPTTAPKAWMYASAAASTLNCSVIANYDWL